MLEHLCVFKAVAGDAEEEKRYLLEELYSSKLTVKECQRREIERRSKKQTYAEK